MARMIKSTNNVTFGVKLSTVFEDGTQTDRIFKPEDIIENLRYVVDGDIVITSGRLSEIRYDVDKVTWDASNPSDTLSNDMKYKDLVIDNSEKYHASSVNVPLFEVVEFEEETNVARMRYSPYIVCDMKLKYSDYRVEEASIEVGDVFDKVMILDYENIENPIRGKFEVLGFSYKVVEGKIVVNGIAFKDVNTGKTVIAGFDQIHALNEVFTYEVNDVAGLTEVLANITPGAVVAIDTVISTAGTPITINKEDVNLALNTNIVADGSANSGISVTSGGKVTLTGEGQVINMTEYDATHSKGIVRVNGDGELVFNGSGVEAIIRSDPVNKGQFGVTIYDSAKLTINDGIFNTGWYCVAGNGSTTGENAVTVINGGTLRSVADYAIYHPHKGKLIVNGGTIVGAAGAIAANAGTIEINGGEFAVLGNGDTGEWADGTSGLGNAALNLNAKYGDVKCIITGGKFHATASGTIMIATGSAHNVDLKIFGGEFTNKPEPEWIAEGYLCTNEPNEEGFYKVYKGLL